MLTIYLISLCTLLTYIIYALVIVGYIPPSLSETYYILKKLKKPYHLFQTTMILSSMTLVPVWIEMSRESLQFLSFLACGGLMFVGSAPLFKEKFERKIHFIGTAIAGAGSMLWIIFSGLHLVPILLLIPLLINLIARSGSRKEWLFWVEMWLFCSTYLAISTLL